ncbi:preprotein translocase subunit SecG [Patescibacteria group bacterium]|nr:preprotein translocase subunit SecG [Patescibacteria group bacterium]
MPTYLQIIQIVLSVLLIIFIILQNKASALGGVFGGETNVYQSKRGVENFLHWGTVVLAILFVVSSVVNLLG